MTEGLSAQRFVLKGEEMVQEMMQALLKKIPEKYPHLRHPAVMKARITGKQETGEWEEKLEVTDELGTRECVLKRKKYLYTIQVLDSVDNADAAFPMIPAVSSRQELAIGEIIAVGLLSGKPEPVILGVCEA